MSFLIGYARVSTSDQTTARQIAAKGFASINLHAQVGKASTRRLRWYKTAWAPTKSNLR
jgi:hypothetical protein